MGLPKVVLFVVALQWSTIQRCGGGEVVASSIASLYMGVELSLVCHFLKLHFNRFYFSLYTFLNYAVANLEWVATCSYGCRFSRPMMLLRQELLVSRNTFLCSVNYYHTKQFPQSFHTRSPSDGPLFRACPFHFLIWNCSWLFLNVYRTKFRLQRRWQYSANKNDIGCIEVFKHTYILAPTFVHRKETINHIYL